MPDSPGVPPVVVRHSVFAKLVTIMLVMAVSLVALVAGFFLLYVTRPSAHGVLFETFPEQLRAAHFAILTVLLLLIVGVVLATHAVLTNLLRPLRGLAAGVARLSGGELDAVVPRSSDDEFGALTDGFNEMVERVRDMVRARDQLLLDVSHDLRSPVTRLKVALELVDDPGMKAAMAADLAEIDIMIGELVELERLRDGHGIRAERRNIVPILEEVARTFHDRPPGVRVTAASPEIVAPVDAERMRTVFRNLIENGVKYSRADSRAVEVSAEQDGPVVIVRVTDDGPGVPDADAAKIFEPFFRGDRSRSRKTGGYGLGLSIARRIVEAHGGTIEVRNNSAGGATFTVTLNVA